MLAHHYINALELMRAAGQELDGVAVRARAALREAGDRALALSALPQALRYYAEALTLTADDQPMRAELLLQHARARSAQNETGEEEAAEAQEAFERTGRREAAAEAALLRADLAWRSGNAEKMQRHLAEARSLVEGLPPSRIQVAILSESSRYAMVSDQGTSSRSDLLGAITTNGQQLGSLRLSQAVVARLSSLGFAQFGSTARSTAAVLARCR